MQTDRQADKATHWNSAVFNVDDNWTKLSVLPEFVKQVHKQEEVCPQTGNHHYQIHVVCNRQVRLTQMCKWISKTNWKPVRGDEFIKNSIAYCSKKDTAIPGTQEVIQGEKYLRMHELLMCIGRAYMYVREDTTKLPAADIPFHMDYALNHAHKFKHAARWLVQNDITWINKICNPVLEKMWNLFYREILEAVHEEEGSFIIEEPVPPAGVWLGE